MARHFRRLPVVSLWANPQHLKDSFRLGELAGMLKLTSKHCGTSWRSMGTSSLQPARHQTPDFARTICEQFPRVCGEREYRRYYPAGEVTAQVLGLTNVDARHRRY